MAAPLPFVAFPDMLRRARAASGMTQKAYAAELGISPAYLNDLEHGNRGPTVKLVNRICSEIGSYHMRLDWHTSAARFHGWEV